jgi:hypothetical protein
LTRWEVVAIVMVRETREGKRSEGRGGRGHRHKVAWMHERSTRGNAARVITTIQIGQEAAAIRLTHVRATLHETLHLVEKMAEQLPHFRAELFPGPSDPQHRFEQSFKELRMRHSAGDSVHRRTTG